MSNLIKWIKFLLCNCFIIINSVYCVQRFVQEPSDLTVNYGEPVLLPCVVSDLKGVLQWTKGGFGLGTERSLVGFDRYHMTGSDDAGNFSLYIRLALVVDDDEYQCQVSGADGEPSLRSKKAKLTVLLGPKADKVFMEQKSPIETTAGSPIRLSCVAGLAKPAAEIKWYNGDKLITKGANSSKRSLENSSLQSVRGWLDITPSKNHHMNNISCKVTHQALSAPIVRSVMMIVKYPPVVTLHIDSVKIKENDDVRFTCKAEGNPTDLTFMWEVNDVKVLGDFRTHYLIEKVGRNLNKAQVKCIVTNGIGQGSAMRTLSVEYGPAFKKEPSNIDGEEGKFVTLSCDVDGNPPPEIFWTSESSPKVINIGSRLRLNVTKETEGVYYCRTAAIGYPEISRSIELFMRGAPRVHKNQESFGLEGSTVQVVCNIRSIPIPSEVVWTRYGVVIDPALDRYSILEQNTADGVQNTLVISDAGKGDFGIYNCTAKNGYGSHTGQIVLNRQLCHVDKELAIKIAFRESMPLVMTLVTILVVLVIFFVAVAVVIVLFRKKGKGYKDSSIEKHSMHSSTGSSANDSVHKDRTRGGTSSDVSPSDEDDDYSHTNDWESERDHLQQNAFRYSDNFVEPVYPTKEGANNNSGYIPYVDYNREYNPPPPAPPGLNYNRNSIYSTGQPLNNVDPRFSATYGNPYLKLPHSAQPNTSPTNSLTQNKNPPMGNNQKNSIYSQGVNKTQRHSSNNQYIPVPQTEPKYGVQGTHI